MLDLGNARIEPEAPGRGVADDRRLPGPSGQGILLHRKPTGPVGLRLLEPALDRPGYAVGEAFIYEVIVENTGDCPIKVPSQLDGSRIDRAERGATMWSIALVLNDEVLGLQLVGHQFLYGSEALSGSLLTVRPGERLRIHAKGEWTFQSGPKRPPAASWVRDVAIRATAHVTVPGVEQIVVSSTDAVRIQLRNE